MNDMEQRTREFLKFRDVKGAKQFAAFAQAEVDRRDNDFWDALCGNDAIAPTPEAIKDYWLTVEIPQAQAEAVDRYKADLTAQVSGLKVSEAHVSAYHTGRVEVIQNVLALIAGKEAQNEEE